MVENVTYCRRCGCPGRPGKGNPESRPIRRAAEGLCINCAMTEFFKTTEPIRSLMNGFFGNLGQEALLSPSIQEQVGCLLEAGNCDAGLEEIDWPTVVSQWDLPFPKSKRKSTVDDTVEAIEVRGSV